MFRILQHLNATVNSVFLFFFKVLRIFTSNDALLDKISKQLIKDGFLRVNYALSSTPHLPSLVDQKYSIVDYSDLSILIQGPISDLTEVLRTINLYQSNFKNAQILLSTWTSGLQKIDTELIDFILSKSLYPDHIHVLLREKPTNSGIANVNFQICSTQAGLSHARELGRKWVLKCRTDQVLTSHNSVQYLRELTSRFGLNENGAERIVCLSKNSFFFRPYSISDMVQYGSLLTLTRFWDIPMDPRLPSDPVAHSSNSAVEWSRNRLAEVYLTASYFEGCGKILDFSLKQHFELLREYFVIGDAEICGVVWPKYTSNSLNWSKGHFPHTTSEISHQDWLDLPLYLQSLEKFEEFTVKKWGR